ncbi:MAG: hypothetical protein LBF25_01360 [Puniceicoccales bacterium]|jgi:hypothetical protein|nr:hypothetical protein [Puniceicoccales bacterium]
MNVMSTLLILLAFAFTIYGEWRRKFLLRKLICDKNLSQVLINCCECTRLIKTLLLTFAGVFLCLALANFEINLQLNHSFSKIFFLLKAYDGDILNLRVLFLELSFCLLSIEQVIPTRKR